MITPLREKSEVLFVALHLFETPLSLEASRVELQKGLTQQFSQFLCCRTRRGGSYPCSKHPYNFREVNSVKWPPIRLYALPEFRVISSGQERIFSQYRVETTVDDADKGMKR